MGVLKNGRREAVADPSWASGGVEEWHRWGRHRALCRQAVWAGGIGKGRVQ